MSHTISAAMNLVPEKAGLMFGVYVGDGLGGQGDGTPLGGAVPTGLAVTKGLAATISSGLGASLVFTVGDGTLVPVIHAGR